MVETSLESPVEQPAQSSLIMEPLELPDSILNRAELVTDKTKQLLLAPQKKEFPTPISGLVDSYVEGKTSIRQVGIASSKEAAHSNSFHIQRLLLASPHRIQEAAMAKTHKGNYFVMAVETLDTTSPLLHPSQQLTNDRDKRGPVFMIVSPTDVAGEMDMWVIGQDAQTVYTLPDGSTTTDTSMVSGAEIRYERVLQQRDTIIGSLHTRFRDQKSIEESNHLPQEAGVFLRNGLQVLATGSDIHDVSQTEDTQLVEGEIPVPEDIQPVINGLREKYPLQAPAATTEKPVSEKVEKKLPVIRESVAALFERWGLPDGFRVRNPRATLLREIEDLKDMNADEQELKKVEQALADFDEDNK